MGFRTRPVKFSNVAMKEVDVIIDWLESFGEEIA